LKSSQTRLRAEREELARSLKEKERVVTQLRRELIEVDTQLDAEKRRRGKASRAESEDPAAPAVAPVIKKTVAPPAPPPPQAYVSTTRDREGREDANRTYQRSSTVPEASVSSSPPETERAERRMNARRLHSTGSPLPSDSTSTNPTRAVSPFPHSLAPRLSKTSPAKVESSHTDYGRVQSSRERLYPSPARRSYGSSAEASQLHKQQQQEQPRHRDYEGIVNGKRSASEAVSDERRTEQQQQQQGHPSRRQQDNHNRESRVAAAAQWAPSAQQRSSSRTSASSRFEMR
jgi:hypothetical protein